MFNNIGDKLRTWATIAFWAQLVAYIAVGIFLIAEANAWDTPAALEEPLIGAAIFCFIGGPGVSWINSALIYGFGELIEKTCIIAKVSKGGANNRQSNIEAKQRDERTDKLERLRAQGLISEEEYQKAMGQIQR